jgi:large subunit ribosomal protein L22
MPVSQALNVLDFTPKKAAQLIGKVLRTAIANAENNHELDTEDMVVRSAVATPGPTLKRITPRARGSAGAIKKRLCHITVVLAAGKEESDEGSSTTKAAVKKAAPRKRAAAKKAEQA